MRSNKPKKLTIQYANRVKLEKINEFEDSLFEQVYRNACRLTRKIIEDNETLETNILDSEYSMDEQFGNIIAFLGGRGMGKSSAMLSFALFLKNYESGSTNDFTVDTQKTSPVFSVLPRIDVAMMVKGENIMDIILAKMWDTFEKRSESAHQREIFLEELKGDFKKVKKSYEIYKMTLAEKEVIQNMTSIRELHELAACLNLRDDFKKLVENYLRFMLVDKSNHSNNRFFVISIDDLDMVMRDAYGILEQIRLFLLIPKVIVLVTADLERLTMVCNKQFTESLINRDNFEDYEKRKVREYAANYLAKLFPGNMRILMPKIGTITGEDYEIVESGETFSEKRLILVWMAKYSHIFYPPYSWKRHFLQKDSLRKIVNNLYLLSDIAKQSREEWLNLICRWYFAELSEYCKSVENTELRQELQGLLEMQKGDLNATYLNRAVRGVLAWAINDESATARVGYDYGDILLLLDKVSNQEKIYNFVSLTYSVHIACIKNKSYCGERIFNSLLAQQSQNTSNRNGMEKLHLLSDHLLDIRLVYTNSMKGEEDVLKIINSNLDNIIEVFKIFFLCGINVYDLKSPGYTNWKFSRTGQGGLTKRINQMITNLEKTDSDVIEIFGVIPNNLMMVSVSMDYLFLNAPYYEQYVRGFIYNLYTSLSKYYGINEKAQQTNRNIEQIVKNPVWHLKEYKSWKKKYNINTISDILPLRSVDLMYNLVKKISSMPIEEWHLSVEGCTINILQMRLMCLLQALENVEEYYKSELLNYQKYSKKISKYLDIIQITDMSDINKRKLDIPDFDSSPTPAV